jgi:16S rRNA (guanine527-N7)-methyltransferase
MSAFQDALRSGAAAIDVSITDDEARACEVHFDLVLRWNKVHNLTRVTDPVEAARRHYLDALAGFALLTQHLGEADTSAAVDVGSGAGYPGLVGAICWPETKWTLLDAAAKRCSFLQLAAGEVGLRNIEVRHQDARKEKERWPLVVSRATFSSGHLDAALSLCASGGRAALWIGDSDVGSLPTDQTVLTMGSTTLLLRDPWQ